MKSGESQEKTEASFSKLGIATIIVADTCFAQKVGWNRDEVREADDRKG
jgi:hypothetical protein